MVVTLSFAIGASEAFASSDVFASRSLMFATWTSIPLFVQRVTTIITGA
jgi:hypothetical protein